MKICANTNCADSFIPNPISQNQSILSHLQAGTPARFPDARWPNAKAANQWAVIEALLRSERLTVAVALERYQVYALSQEVGRLKALGWPILSERTELPSGKNVSIYWLEIDRQAEMRLECSR